jgi:choline-phosphate cytidylyltransferase
MTKVENKATTWPLLSPATLPSSAMDPAAAAVAARTNVKRSPALAKIDQTAQDSPAYDASDEDASDRTESNQSLLPQPLRPLPRPKQVKSNMQASHLVDSDTGTDSPTYDGDIESSTNTVKQAVQHRSLLSISSTNSGSPTTTTIVTPSTSVTTLHPGVLVQSSQEPEPVSAASEAFHPSSLEPEDIQAFVRKAIEGEAHRKYKINPPPTDRPVRVYADGECWFDSTSKCAF